MEFLDLATYILLVVFPPLAGYVLPAKIATKVNVVTKAVKGVATVLEAIDKTKGGLTAETDRG